MPITKSAKKKHKQDKKRHLVNLKQKEKAKDAIISFKKRPTAGELTKLFSTLDISSKKKIFHPNKAARLKSRLSKLLKKKSS